MANNSIDNIIVNALFYIKQLNCSSCGVVDFYINNKIPHCDKCKHILTVNYSDLAPVGLLPERAPILRYSSLVAI